MTRRRVKKVVVFLCSLLAGNALAEPVTAVVGARVYSEGAEKTVTFLIAGNKIVDTGSDLQLPTDALIVDAEGYIVVPAFMNSATHLGLVEVSSVAETVDFVASAGETSGAGFDVQYALNLNSELLAQARIDGLSRAITFPARAKGATFSGLGALLHLGYDSVEVETARVALFLAIGGEAGDSRSSGWLDVRQWLDIAGSRLRQPRDLSNRGTYSFWADLSILADVLERRLPMVINTHRESDIRQAVALAEDFGIRVILVGGAESWAVADLLAARGIPVILDPTLNLPLYFDQLRARDDTAAILHAAGVEFAFMTSSIHTTFNAGFALREAAGIAASNGLSRSAAIEALTINPARIWGLDDRYGSISKGQDADFVIWDGDPLEPSSSPLRIYLQGREVPLETRRTRLRDRYRPDATTP